MDHELAEKPEWKDPEGWAAAGAITVFYASDHAKTNRMESTETALWAEMATLPMTSGVFQPLPLHHDSSIPASKLATRAKKRCCRVVSTSGCMLALLPWKVMQSEENTGKPWGREKGWPKSLSEQ